MSHTYILRQYIKVTIPDNIDCHTNPQYLLITTIYLHQHAPKNLISKFEFEYPTGLRAGLSRRVQVGHHTAAYWSQQPTPLTFCVVIGRPSPYVVAPLSVCQCAIAKACLVR